MHQQATLHIPDVLCPAGSLRLATPGISSSSSIAVVALEAKLGAIPTYHRHQQGEEIRAYMQYRACHVRRQPIGAQAARGQLASTRSVAMQ